MNTSIFVYKHMDFKGSLKQQNILQMLRNVKKELRGSVRKIKNILILNESLIFSYN